MMIDPIDQDYINRTAALVRAGQSNEAVLVAHAWVRHRPWIFEASYFFTLSLMNNGQPREAIVAADMAAMMFPQKAEAHILRGRIFDGQGDARAMFRAYRQAALLDRRNAEARKGLGDALFRLNRPERAARAFHRAVRLAPDDASYRGALALCLASLHRYADALEEWESAIRLDRTYFWDPRDEKREAELVLRRHCRERVSLDGGNSPSSGREEFPQSQSDVLATGTGFYIAPGTVVTNAHVIRDTQWVRIDRGGATPIAADVKAIDTENDLALLQTAERDVFFGHIRTQPVLRAGEEVVIVGYPLAGLLANEAAVTCGHIGALAGLRNDRRYLQIAAPIQPGNSGGPLLDRSGNVIGIVSGKLNPFAILRSQRDFPQSITFAIHGSTLRSFLELQGVACPTATWTRHRTIADVADIGRRLTVRVLIDGP